MNSFSDYIVDQTAIKHNLMQYKKLDNKSKICAVVKADGYGLGAKNVFCAIDDEVDFYAVACFVEAKKLRKLTKKNILILNSVKKSALKFCAEHNISVSVFSLKHIEEILSSSFNGKIKVHIAINTGMNRVGFSFIDEFVAALNILKNHPDKFEVEGIFTHLYNASSVKASKKQVCIFMQYLDFLAEFFDINKIMKHVCASFAAVKYPNFRFDMVRLGILLYGDIDDKKLIDLKPVLNVTSRVINLTKIKKGDHVGYGTKFLAKKDTTVATVPIGYADGIIRAFAKHGCVFIKGKKCNIVGNICMDMFMADVGMSDIKVGDEVQLLGVNQTAGDIAKNCGTISYEILTNIKKNRFNVKVLKK